MKYGARWLKTTYKLENISPLGEEVAEFLNVLGAGIYHLGSSGLKKADWVNDYCIAINLSYPSNFATYDFDLLTKIVVLSHDRCLRVEMQAVAPRIMKLMFHRRERGATTNFAKMPTLEEHTATLREQMVDWD